MHLSIDHTINLLARNRQFYEVINQFICETNRYRTLWIYETTDHSMNLLSCDNHSINLSSNHRLLWESVNISPCELVNQSNNISLIFFKYIKPQITQWIHQITDNWISHSNQADHIMNLSKPHHKSLNLSNFESLYESIKHISLWNYQTAHLSMNLSNNKSLYEFIKQQIHESI